MIFHNYAELFSGAGGMALGSIQAENLLYSIKPVWALDREESACETYSRNIGNHSACLDAWDLNPEDIPDIQGLGFGFPCNDFSAVGKQKGLDGDYGKLYLVAAGVLRAKQPLWFVAENVDGLSSANGAQALPIILKELSECGYDITPHKYKLEEYGIPQTRHRIFIVGFRKDLGIKFLPPAPTMEIVTAEEALKDIPESAQNQEKTRQGATVVERLKHIPPGKNAWCEEIPENLRLNVKGAKLSSIYRRLDPSKPAYTVTAGGGGGTYMYHRDEPRALTNRERARLQTFPDNFFFEGNKGEVRKQIGMAVPPKAARMIFEHVLKAYAGTDYESTPANIKL